MGPNSHPDRAIGSHRVGFVEPQSQPLGRGARGSRGAEAFLVTPFMQLARTHVLGTIGDTLITIALAGSLFFSLDVNQARSRVGLYLLLTAAPFAVVSPLIGPMIDRARGGRRWMVVLAQAGRAVTALLMIRHLNSFLLFPEAFTVLVLGKAYHIAKSAIVPSLVRDQDALMKANSRLVLAGGLASALTVGPALLLRLLGDRFVLLGAVVAFTFAAAQAFKLPPTTVAEEPVGELEKAELRGGGILLAASAMALLRWSIGFLTFMLIFWLRGSDASPVWYGVIGSFAVAGNLLGALIAPALRQVLREEMVLGGVLAVSAITATVVSTAPERLPAAFLGLVLGLSTGLGKLSFDAIVQRDAPDANKGRSFARFETRFQLAWVTGAIIPVVLFPALPVRLGFIVLAIGSALGAFFYLGGLRALARGMQTPSDRLKKRILADQRVRRVRDRLSVAVRVRTRATGSRAEGGGATGAVPPSNPSPDATGSPGGVRGPAGKDPGPGGSAGKPRRRSSRGLDPGLGPRPRSRGGGETPGQRSLPGVEPPGDS